MKTRFGDNAAALTLIPVREWAAVMFPTRPPHYNTLLSWVHDGKIAPLPIKVGRQWFCSPDARYFDATTEKIRRMVD